MTRRNRLADLLRFYGDRPRAGDARDPIESERDWIDVDAEDDGDGDPEAGLPLARTFGPGTRPLTWKEHLGALRHAMDSTREDSAPDWPPGREVLYVVDPAATIAQGALVLEVLARDPRKRGGFTQLRRLGLRRTQLAALPEAADREILALLGGTRDPDRLWLDSHPSYGAVSHRYLVPPDLHGNLMPLLCRTGRAWLRASPAEADLVKLGWDDGPAFTPSLDVRADPKSGYYIITGSLCRGPSEIELSEVRLLLAGGLVFVGERVARVDDHGAFPWLAHLRRHGSMRVPLAQGGAFLDALLRLPRLPRLELPDELQYEEITAPPRPRLRVRAAPSHWGSQRLRAALSFDYDGAIVRMDRDSGGVFQAERRRFLRRDASAERQAWRASARPASASAPCTRATARARHSTCPRGTWRARWASSSRRAGGSRPRGSCYRPPGEFKLEVSSGIDWFELHGDGRLRRRRSRAARAARGAPRGGETIVAARRRHAAACCRRSGCRSTACSPTLGDASGRSRCASGAARSALLDALLAGAARGRASTRPSRASARSCARSRASSRSTRRRASSASCAATSARASAGSTSSSSFGFGGCLADDMGLGKTVQVLALLAARARQRRRGARRRRWSSCRARWSSTGCRRPRASRPSCACSTTPAPSAPRPRERFAELRPGPHHLRHAPPRRRRASRTSSSTT